MAGDWIKIEKATAAKPEILELAERLNLHTDHVLGLCVRFWSWCDDQLHDGNALRVTTSRLDALFGHPGFVPALIEVGWLRVCAGSLVVPNFDRHLSESAKSRGLTRKRVQKIRAKTERPAVTLAALPEKRREERRTREDPP